jgi:Flp pilus assembly protein CpaB
MSRSVILKVLLLAAALAVLVATPAGSATKVLFPANCGKPTFKPKSIVVACADANNRLTSIKWQTYGTRAASGTATAKVNDCTPNCVSGKVKSYPAVVTLTRPKNCGRGVTQFTRLVETFTHSRPSGTSKRLGVTFPCSS